MNYEGLYRGIVVQNNDPLNSGRVKVFVPGINLTQIENWNQQNAEDKYFKVVGRNTESAITSEILENQKEKLIWAEVMMPIMGASAPGTYHAPSDQYYIGNDSDYNSQQSNKNDAAFAIDAAQALARLSTSPPLPSYGKPPRNELILDFPQMGSKFCVNTGCKKKKKDKSNDNGGNDGGDDEDEIISIINRNDPVISTIIGELPRIYKETKLILDPDEEVDIPNSDISIRKINTDEVVPIVNESVLRIVVKVIDPDIYVNDVAIPKDSPIYNEGCFDRPNLNQTLAFEPPINFIESGGTPQGKIDNVPVRISVNEKEITDIKFKLLSHTETTITYINDTVKVVVPRSNITSVEIHHTNVPFSYTRIQNIQPIISRTLVNKSGGTGGGGSPPTVFSTTPRMPRAPMPFGGNMSSRGGGGGELFNHIISLLLPIFMRLDAHLGGANNESRMSCNRGRKPSNDPNNVKGANIAGNANQSHRGPMRAPNYSNAWKGMISIPGIGAHVWVHFECGDPNYPIVIGTFAAQESYKGIYETKPVKETTPEEDVQPAPTDPAPAAPDGDTLENPNTVGDGNRFEDRPQNTNSEYTPIDARQTSFGYSNDKPDKDGLNRSGIGVGFGISDEEEAFIRAGGDSPNKMIPGDIALSPDMVTIVEGSGVSRRDNMTVIYDDGTTHTGRYMDKTATYLSGRIDLYAPDGQHPLDGKRIIGFMPGS